MLNLINHSIQKGFQFVFLFLFSLYLVFSPSLNLLAFDEKRIIELLLISLTLFNICFDFKTLNQTPYFNFKFSQQLSLACLVLLLILSSLQAANINSALLEISLTIGLIFFCLTIGKITKENSRIMHSFFFITLTVSALFYLTNSFTAYFASFIENIPLRWPEPFSGFSNIRFFNQYQIWSIPLISLPILLYPSLDKRLLNGLKIIAIGWAILLFASGSRGAVSSVIISLALSFIIFRSYAKPLLKLNSILLLAGLSGYLILFKFLPWALNNEVTLGWKPISQFASSNARIELWQFALQYIADNPWLGIGPMHYAYYPGPGLAHPHNSILQWTCETGIPSILLLIFLIFSGLTAWVKKFHRLQEKNKLTAPAHLWIALFCSMISGLIYSLVSGVIVMPLSQIMMALIAGWMLGIYFQDQKNPHISKIQGLSFKLLAGITLITLVYTVLPSLVPRLSSSYADLPYQSYTVHTPRFWQIGGVPH